MSLATTSQKQSPQEWQVTVYRRPSTGWQVMRPLNSKKQTVPVKARVQEGCILIPAVKVRLQLLGNEEGKAPMVIQRRGATVLITGAQPVRAIALSFRHEQACLEFVDCLIALNPPTTTDKPPGTGAAPYDDRPGQSQETLAYIHCLLHDDNFLGFVNRLESCLSSSEDGKQILDYLVSSKLKNDEAS